MVSLKGHFGPGQVYVALSRCKTIDNLYGQDNDEDDEVFEDDQRSSYMEFIEYG